MLVDRCHNQRPGFSTTSLQDKGIFFNMTRKMGHKTKEAALYFNSGKTPYRELRPGLFFGRRLTETEAKEIQAEAVLDLTAEYDEVPEFLRRDYLNVPILDLTSPSVEQLRQAVEHIRSHATCYVHCSLGRGRTGAVAAAYLITEGMCLEDALAEIKRFQPDLKLARGAHEVLQGFADTIS